MSMGRKGVGLSLSVVIAVGGIFFPPGSPLTSTQGSRPGVAGGWPAAGVRLPPRGFVAEAAEKPRQSTTAYGSVPLYFEANRGQTDPQVNFLARGADRVVFLTPTEAVLVLPTANDPRKAEREGARASRGRPEDRTATVLRMRFAGANPTPRVTGLEPLPGTANYFIGNDRAKWHTNVPLYARVQYEDVYPGIDLSFYGTPRGDQAGVSRAHGGQQQLEYDFVVRPGADPSTIALVFQGA